MKARFTVTNDRVVLTRPAILSVILLLLLAPGIYCITQAFRGSRLDETMFAIAFPCVMLGLFSLFMTPWMMPGSVVVEPRGVTWGKTFYPREQIVNIWASSSLLRSSQYKQHLSWSMGIGTQSGKALALNLGEHNPRTRLDRLQILEAAFVRVLGLPPRQPVQTLKP